MRFWLIKLDEKVFCDNQQGGLARMGRLADTLKRRGHQVTWWTSTFDHIEKRHRYSIDTRIDIDERLTIRFLHAVGYRNNISIGRFANHVLTARKFVRVAAGEPRPDLILTALPSPNVCRAAAEFGLDNGIPVVIDVRDLWPDIFAEVLPSWLKNRSAALLWPFARTVRAALGSATAISAITPGFVDWGLKYAGRGPTPLDCAFPLAYTSEQPSSADQERAREFWGNLGITGTRDKFLVCYIGAFGQRNEAEMRAVISAAKRLESAAPEARLVLCGAGVNFETYKRLAAGHRNIVFSGWIGFREIWVLMRYASIGLVPYQSTIDFRLSIPNKAIEYLSAGLPVISSIQGVLQSFLATHDCGVTYENLSPDGLVEAISSLRSEPARLRRMSENATAVYEQMFVAEKVYAEMAEHLESIVINRRNSGAYSGTRAYHHAIG
jgi:glycosyltransferase involved in cell wall biosynthesis